MLALPTLLVIVIGGAIGLQVVKARRVWLAHRAPTMSVRTTKGAKASKGQRR